MDAQLILRISQMAISVILIALILLQRRGSGLSGVFGGGGAEFYGTRRGLEKVVFMLTIVFACLFAISAILGLVLS
jgi:preprotein translocase subunit SecG